ncbi:MAG: FAD-dependent oxidoreductase [Candidatus Marinimicrobia bacterium]|jgi:formate dehydrogenase beta subunit|nr:FAD-dependent oxidoreductase [Candidatus Neomarinimicrobiota bacterium]
MINLTIDNKQISTKENKTILEVALENDIYIPNLCYHPDLKPESACRLCSVEIEGRRGISAACDTQIHEGMVIKTKTEKLQNHRKNIIWLTLSELPKDISPSTQLKKVVDHIGVKELLSNYAPEERNLPILSDEPLFVRNMNRCILCGRCVNICQEVRETGVIGFANRGIDSIIATAEDKTLRESGCKFCLACVEVCPSGALTDVTSRQFDVDNAEEREKALVPCKGSCPAGTNAAHYVKLIAEGKYQDAYEVNREISPLVEVLGRVCFHPCETECKRNDLTEPISIRALKRFVAEKDNSRWKDKLKITSDTNKKVAIIGSGPAGLTAGWFLRTKGHSVTIFEADEKAGGMMRTAIPKYRLPREILDNEINEIKNIGVKIELSNGITFPDKLLKEGYDAVYIAIGTSGTMNMRVSGSDNPNVLDGLSLLRSINNDEKIDVGKKVGIVGGGNVAMDVARCLLRNGIDTTVIYRRSREQMPATDEEIEETMNEGVNFKFLNNPIEINNSKKANKIDVKCIKMKLGEPDSSGRKRPIPIEGSEYDWKLDKLIMAIGQKSDVPDEFGLEKDKWNNIKTGEDLSTNKKGIFAGGDVVSGPASVIEAINFGRIGASSIDKFLGGDGNIDQNFIDKDEPKTCLGRDVEFVDRKRKPVKTIPIKDRENNFNEVELNFEESVATSEADRCLRCQLRLGISKAPFPPDKN